MVVNRIGLVVGLLCNFALGVAVSTANPWCIGLSVLQPAFSMLCSRRRDAYWIAFAYYAGVLPQIVPAALNFFGPGSSLLKAIAYYLTPCFLLSLPWPAVWSSTRTWWRAPLGLVLSIVPPLGLIAFASPVTAAGILFPGTGWIGLAALIAVVAGLSAVPRATIMVCISVIALTNARYKAPLPPRDWEAVQTHFGRLSEDDAIDQFRAVEAIQSRALASKAKIIVFPEAVIRYWTDATEVFWQPTFDELQREGKTILVGAIVRRKAQTENVVQIRGAQTGSMEQRLPIPMVMWNPFQQSGFRLRLNHPSSYKLGRYRASLLICYETVVPWPLLTADIASADVIVAIANMHWAQDTSVAAWQYSAVQAWARLFKKATVWSSNTTAPMSNRTQRDRSIGLAGL